MNKQAIALAAASILVAALLGLAGCTPSGQQAQSSQEASGKASSSSEHSSSKAQSSAKASSNASSSASSSSESSQAPAASAYANDQEITDAIVDNFLQIAAIPRPSGGEAAVSDWLRAWAEERGFEVEQDARNNLVFDVPATQGLEDLPAVGLQAHMDMVCIAADGVAYDPRTSPIAVVRNDDAGTLVADGTSLGADDGIGIAMIMDIVEGNMAHGPLRVILTTDEEGGMTGIAAISPSDVDDLSYLVNLDGKDADSLVVSSAGGVTITASASLDTQAPTGSEAATITLDGLLGGHSGFQIGEGRCNAIRAMAGLLDWLDTSGFSFELASLEGGTADNAIPARATATIVFAAGSADDVRGRIAEYADRLKENYPVETGLVLDMAAANMPELVLAHHSMRHTLDYALNIIDGVYTVLADLDNLAESSSNLGVLTANCTNGLSALTFIRSLDNNRLVEIQQQQLSCAAENRIDARPGDVTAPWPYNPDNKLIPLCEDAYEQTNGQGSQIEVDAIHGTLECGTFCVLNPSLDVVSIGPDVLNEHTPNETLMLDSLPKMWHLLEGVLPKVS